MVDISDLLTRTGHWTSEDEEGEILGTGSCWPLSGDLVVTNFHVASLGPKATVEFEYLGVMPVIGLVAVDKPRDLVIAKVRTGKLLKLPVFNVCEEFPRVGTDVYVLGSPCGLKQSVSRGIMSAIRSATDLAEFGVKGRKMDRFVQVDAAISQGCSGGPIIDSNGTVVAISTFILARGQALNFGVPSAYACELLDLAEECKPLSQYCQASPTAEVRGFHGNPDVGSIAAAGTAQATERDVIDYFIRLYALVIAADGEISENEQIMMFRVSQEWGFSHSQVIQALDNYSQDAKIHSSTQLAGHAAAYLKYSLNSNQKNSILMDLIRISKADGISTAEAEIITAIKEVWDEI